MKENIESIYAEFPWWLIKDIPWGVVCSSNPKEPLLGFLRVCVTQSSLSGWKEIYHYHIIKLKYIRTKWLLKGRKEGQQGS